MIFAAVPLSEMWLRSVCQPALKIGGDESVVVEFGIGVVDPGDLLCLSGRKYLFRVDAPDTGKQSLTAQHFVESGDTSGKAV